MTVHIYGREYKDGFKEKLSENLSPPYFPITLGQLAGDPEFGTMRTGDRLILDTPWEPPRFVPAGEEAKTRPQDLVVRAFHNKRHPNGGVLNLRVEHLGRSFVYATDVEGDDTGDPKLAEFARETDLLIHDAMYTYEEYNGGVPGVKGFGHSSLNVAVEAARAAGARRLALFHHEPLRSDDELEGMEEEARKLFPESFAAREGEVVDLLE